MSWFSSHFQLESWAVKVSCFVLHSRSGKHPDSALKNIFCRIVLSLVTSMSHAWLFLLFHLYVTYDFFRWNLWLTKPQTTRALTPAVRFARSQALNFGQVTFQQLSSTISVVMTSSASTLTSLSGVKCQRSLLRLMLLWLFVRDVDSLTDRGEYEPRTVEHWFRSDFLKATALIQFSLLKHCSVLVCVCFKYRGNVGGKCWMWLCSVCSRDGRCCRCLTSSWSSSASHRSEHPNHSQIPCVLCAVSQS